MGKNGIKGAGVSIELTPLPLWALYGPYHPDRNDETIPGKGAEMICHAKDRAGAALKIAAAERQGFPSGEESGSRFRTEAVSLRIPKTDSHRTVTPTANAAR